LIIGCIVSLFFAYQFDKKPSIGKEASSKSIENGAVRVKYTMKLKDGFITISSAKAAIKSFDSIILSDVAVLVSRNLKKAKKRIKITAENCELKPKKKKANLSGEILIRLDDFSARTRFVSIDWLDGTISGNSQISGQRDGIKFTASGFSMKRGRKIELKNAKIEKRK
jgi:hypothetical protein